MKNKPTGARGGAAFALLLALFLFNNAALTDQIQSGVRPSPALEQYQNGVAALERGNLSAAQADFQESLRTDPKQSASRIALAEIAVHQGKPQEAQRLLQSALSVAPRDAEAHAAWGRYLFHSTKQYTKAAQAFLAAIRLNPNSVPYQIELGDVYMTGLHQPKLAIEHYQAAVHIDPQNATAHYALANALAAAGDLKGAVSEYGEVSRLVPRSPLPHMALGDIQAVQGDRAGALKEYNAALQLSPKLATAYLKIGMIDQLDHRTPGAMRAYQPAVGLDPKLAVAYNNMAFLAVEQKVNVNQALGWAQKAAELAPKSSQVLDTLGWVYHSRGQSSQALPALEQATAISPKDPQILYHLGVVYTDNRQPEKATQTLREALALKTGFPEMADARSRLASLSHSR